MNSGKGGAPSSWLEQLGAFNRCTINSAAGAQKTEGESEQVVALEAERLLQQRVVSHEATRTRSDELDSRTRGRTHGSSSPVSAPVARGKGASPMHHIPKFWVKKESARTSVQTKLSHRAMALFIERQSEELLPADVLRALLAWPMHRVNYDQFSEMGKRLGPQYAKEYFRATTFLRFERDRGGRISVAAFVGFVVRREELLRFRLHLSCYSSDLSGFITMVDLQHYVSDVVTSLPQLRCIDGFDEMFLPFYTLTAVSKFFFFLDPMHRGKVRVRDVACSAEASELDELRETSNEYRLDAPFVAPWEGGNWFSPHFAMQFYRYYLMLDVDRNGLLSKEEIRQFGQPPVAQPSAATGKKQASAGIEEEDGACGQENEGNEDQEDEVTPGGGGGLLFPVPPCLLTDVFIDRVFEECRLYDGEMDYKTFVDFTLAMTYKHRPESLAYFFKLLDVRNRGHLTAFEIQFFFREILAGIRALIPAKEPAVSTPHGAESLAGDVQAPDSAAQLAEFSGNVSLEDVRDEIFDMVNPVKAGCITLDDLTRCGVGSTVVAMLVDVKGFYDYDNREVLMVSSNHES